VAVAQPRQHQQEVLWQGQGQALLPVSGVRLSAAVLLHRHHMQLQQQQQEGWVVPAAVVWEATRRLQETPTNLKLATSSSSRVWPQGARCTTEVAGATTNPSSSSSRGRVQFVKAVGALFQGPGWELAAAPVAVQCRVR
jgi:hypothetical protein